MQILRLEAKNFMSFEELDYDFEESGLYFIGGEVQGKRMSNSNGAGKSSFIEALCYGLYGETIRKADIGDIVNWAVGKDCFVEVDIAEKGDIYLIKRYREDEQHGNSLYLYKNGDEDLTGAKTADTQTTIDNILGMPWLVFCSAVVFGEKATRFADARDSDKKAIFDEILMLHRFQEALRLVREDIKALVAEEEKIGIQIDSERKLLADAESELEVVNFRLKELEKEEKDAEVVKGEKEEEVKGLTSLFEEAEANLCEQRKSLEELTGNRNKLLSELTEAQTKASEEIEALSKVAMEHKIKASTLKNQMDDLAEKAEQADEIKDWGICPTCGQKITADTVSSLREHYEKELETIKPKYESVFLESEKQSRLLDEKSREWKKHLENISNQKQIADKQIQAVTEAVYSYEKVKNEIDGNIRLLKREIQDLEASFRNRRQLLIEDVKRWKEKIEKGNLNLEELVKKTKDVAEDLIYHKFWIEGFGNKGIKSFLLDEIVPYLNTKVSYYASALLDDEIRIEFDTESKLKSGDTRDKFDVKILRGDEEKRYKSCSSGEKRRIDVAILLALQNLIFQRSVGSCNLIVFDELFDSLDIRGIEKAIDLLSEEASEKAIYVISHSSELKDYFNNVILITRDEQGISHLEV